MNNRLPSQRLRKTMEAATARGKLVDIKFEYNEFPGAACLVKS